MITFLSVVLIMIGLLAMVLTFFQESDGGVLGTTSNNAVLSVKSTSSFLERATFFCLIAIIVLSLTINYIHLKGAKESILDRAPSQQTQHVGDDVSVPDSPSPTSSSSESGVKSSAVPSATPTTQIPVQSPAPAPSRSSSPSPSQGSASSSSASVPLAR